MNINKHIPIETDRLILDRYEPEDYEALYEIEKSPEYHRFNSEEFSPASKEDIKWYTIDLSEQNYNALKLPLSLAIRLKESKKFIGYIGLKNGTLAKGGSIEVYYSIDTPYWNRGYATEALKGLILFCFTTIGTHRIFAGTDIDNIGSKRVMEKAGMRFESRWRKDRIRNGIRTDGLGFAILREDLLN